jgi:NADH-quinone oxidoreductase subunit N
MNAYLLSQLPLVGGFALLLILASFRPRPTPGFDRLTHVVTLAAIAGSALLASVSLFSQGPLGAHFLQVGQQFFGGAIRVTLLSQPLAVGALWLTFLALLFSDRYLHKIRVSATDFRLIVLVQALGFFHLPLAGDLATLFIAFELVSIPSYILAGFNHRDARANEAGMKYLVLGAFASALFLLGVAFLYGGTGRLMLTDIEAHLDTLTLANAPEMAFVRLGLVLMLTGMLFKVAAAPFHLWLADVYQGVNLASLALIAAPAKVALFGMTALVLWGPFHYLHETWKPVLFVIALFCALFGNLQAVLQTRIKRLLAFSSVANAGFLLIAICLDAFSPFLFYLMTYGLTTLGILAALAALGTRTADLEEIDDLRGLGRRHPWISGALTVMLFSLAGIPLTAGFATKLSLAAGAFAPDFRPAFGLVPVLAISVIFSLVSFYFYFKMVRALWLQPAPADASTEPRALDFGALLVTGFVALAILAMGVLMYMPGMP